MLPSHQIFNKDNLYCTYIICEKRQKVNTKYCFIYAAKGYAVGAENADEMVFNVND